MVGIGPLALQVSHGGMAPYPSSPPQVEQRGGAECVHSRQSMSTISSIRDACRIQSYVSQLEVWLFEPSWTRRTPAGCTTQF